jgi:hypothetical protein
MRHRAGQVSVRLQYAYAIIIEPIHFFTVPSSTVFSQMVSGLSPNYTVEPHFVPGPIYTGALRDFFEPLTMNSGLVEVRTRCGYISRYQSLFLIHSAMPITGHCTDLPSPAYSHFRRLGYHQS